MKMSETLDVFLSECDIKDSSIATYRKVLTRFFLYLSLKKLDFNKIKREHIIVYKKYLLSTNKAAGVNLSLSVIRRYYDWADTSGLYTNVARGIKLVKVPHTYKRLPLTINQVDCLLDAVDRCRMVGKRDYLLINLMVKTGLRRIEVNRLNVGDLQCINDKFILKIQRKGHDSKDVYKVISNKLAEELQEYICLRDNIRDADPLFISYSHASGVNHRLSVDEISKIVKRRLNAIGLTDALFSCHSLRHTAAVILLESGFDMHYVQLFMGHSSPATTQLYTKVISDRIALDDKGVNSLEKVFKN